jgi:phosphoglycolate phosphatase
MTTGFIFDLDGTLLDSLGDITDAMNHTLRQFGFPEQQESLIRAVTGNGAEMQIRGALPEGTEEATVYAMLADYKAYYNAHCCIRTVPYPGILEAMETLHRRFPLAVVSNKPDLIVKQLCARFFPGVYALGESAAIPRKPAPDMIFEAMKQIGADRCVYVGDSQQDVIAAKNAGMPCLSVLWGFRTREQIEEAGGRYFCEKTQDMARMLEKIAGEVYGK